MANRITTQSFIRYPLSTMLANESHVRVLRELSRHGGELSVSALSDRTSLTPQGIRNVLDPLVDCGAVEMVGTGKSRLYRIGEHPLMAAVGALFAAEEEAYQTAMDVLKEAVDDDKGIIAAWVYGSVARGEDGPTSDIDVAIVTADAEVERAADRLRQWLMSKHTLKPANPSVVPLGKSDVVRLATGDPWWASLAQDARLLKGRRPDDLARKLASGGQEMAR